MLFNIVPKGIILEGISRDRLIRLVNPFKYGKIVSGDDFADREKETKQLFGDLKSGQNILLYSPRRYGKTSLIFRTLDLLKKDGVMTSYVDVYGCLTASDLMDKIIQETIVPAQRTLQRIGDFLREQFSDLRPEVTLNTDGSVSVSFKKEVQVQGTEKVLPKILDAPEKLAETKKKQLVIAFDEFQEITGMDGLDLEKSMRSSFQRHKNVTYLFAGSKQHVMEEIFGQERRPFYKFAKPFPLEKIPIKQFATFVASKFKETGISISPAIVDSVLHFTQGHPYLTQQLCHELWNISSEQKEAKEEDISTALNTILSQHGDYFSKIWDSLASSQKKIMTAIAEETQVRNIYSTHFITKHALVSASHVKKALHYLEKEALVEHSDGVYYIEDIFLREWIRVNLCSCAAGLSTSFTIQKSSSEGLSR